MVCKYAMQHDNNASRPHLGVCGRIALEKDPQNTQDQHKQSEANTC